MDKYHANIGYCMNLPQEFSGFQYALIYALFIWSLFWKGVAMWKASKYDQRNWFIVLLVLNTIGILEIIYLFGFAKSRMSIREIKEGFKKLFYTKSED